MKTQIESELKGSTSKRPKIADNLLLASGYGSSRPLTDQKSPLALKCLKVLRVYRVEFQHFAIFVLDQYYWILLENDQQSEVYKGEFSFRLSAVA